MPKPVLSKADAQRKGSSQQFLEPPDQLVPYFIFNEHVILRPTDLSQARLFLQLIFGIAKGS